MKKSLLATAAAIAIFAGTGTVMAEGAKDQPAAKSGATEMNRGADTKGSADVKGGADMKGKAETTGQGASGADNKAGADTKGKAENKANVNGDKAKPSTTGQSSTDTKSNMDQKSQPQRGVQSNERNGAASKDMNRSSTHEGAAQDRQNQTTGQAAAGSTQAGGAVNLTSEQKTKVRTTVLDKGPKVSRSSINFNIGVGTVVPRSVSLVAVPSTLVEIHPAWRGYRYFVVDEEVIIVEPSSMKIVAVLNV